MALTHLERGVGGGVNFLSDLGAFLNSLFHSEHSEFMQAGGIQSTLTVYEKCGKMGGGGWGKRGKFSVPGPTGA